MPSFYLSSSSIAECVSNLIARNKLWLKKRVKLFFIVNSAAGCFTNKKIAQNYNTLFQNTNNEILKNSPCAKSVDYEIYETEYQCHAKEITKNIVSEILNNFDKTIDYIIVSVGGDGTSLEVQSSLYDSVINYKKQNIDISNKIAILRLPLGTGNDGTDGSYIEETFNMLKSGIIYSNTKVLVAYTENNPPTDAIKSSHKFISKYCDINSKAPWYAFNIASVGLDAFVSFVTNFVKSKFPGNLYHLCVPLSGLFFYRVFEVGNTKIDMYRDNEEKPFNSFSGKILLTAMGASGNRTYGGGQKVLPNFNNICVCPRVTLARLIKDNKKFVDGTHAGTDIGMMYLADKIKIYNDKPMLLQCDGEAYLLCRDHFPLTIEKRDPGYKIIKKIDS